MKPLTPEDARACCTCHHWHREDKIFGRCHHPEMGPIRIVPVDYQGPTPFHRTGQYATCPGYLADGMDAPGTPSNPNT